MSSDITDFPVVRAAKALHLLQEAVVLLESSGAHAICLPLKMIIDVLHPHGTPPKVTTPSAAV